MRFKVVLILATMPFFGLTESFAKANQSELLCAVQVRYQFKQPENAPESKYALLRPTYILMGVPNRDSSGDFIDIDGFRFSVRHQGISVIGYLMEIYKIRPDGVVDRTFPMTNSFAADRQFPNWSSPAGPSHYFSVQTDTGASVPREKAASLSLECSTDGSAILTKELLSGNKIN